MKPRCQSFWLLGSLSLFWLAITSPLRAEIVQDATLPNPSIVTPNGSTSVITGGTQAGPNLFHSFKEFSVPNGGGASFQQLDQGIDNVISRVTGSSVSNIDGLISVLGEKGNVSEVNFFLLNPNGIIFGPNATLAIGGSFLASTASSLNFADGNQFSATAPQNTSLLSVSVPLGLQFGETARSILNQSQALDSSGYPVGLQVQPGKTLALVGGDVALAGGTLTAEGGRIELGSVAGTDLVSLTPTDFGWTLGYEGVKSFQDIQLFQQAVVNASGDKGGDIQVQGRRVSVRDGSQIAAITLKSEPGGTLSVTAADSVELVGGTVADGNFFASGLFTQAAEEATGAGGNLSISAGKLIIREGSQVSSITFGMGRAGDLTVRAKEVELVGGTVADGNFFSSNLFTQTTEEATGAGGNLSISAGKLILRDRAQVNSSTFGVGHAGDLTVTAENLIVREGAQVNSITFGVGRAGDVTVAVSGSIELVGGIVAADDRFNSSGLLTTAEAGATGSGGNLSISTKKLIVRDGAQVNSTTYGVARAGNLTVRATDVELFGAALSADGELVTNERGLLFASGLYAGTGIGSGGDGGTLSVETNRLSLWDGAKLQTSTLGAGNAGDLTVQATDSVELIGTAKGSQNLTSLLAVSGGIPGSGLAGVPEAKGRGGNLRIETGELIVQNGAAVAVSSLNTASVALGAGNLQITAQSIRLDNEGELTAATASGDGGNITLLVQDLLLLRRNSEISTSAGIAAAGGDGGNITIDTPFIVAVPKENSDITANAFEGAGGLIQIAAQQVFGLERREQLTPLSDITAFSQQNPELNGIVEINTPDIDPSRGLVNLPAEVVDASELIASGCGAPDMQGQSEFIVTGRGGLPSNPSDTLSSDTVWSDLRPQARQAQNLTSSEQATQQTLPTTGQVVEAQGWVINNKGEVVLTAQAPTVTPHSHWQGPPSCSGS